MYVKWSDELFKNCIFDVMLMLDIKRMPKTKEINSLKEFSVDGVKITSNALMNAINVRGGINFVAQQFKLTR